MTEKNRSHAYYLAHKEKWRVVYKPRARAKETYKAWARAYQATYMPKWWAANRERMKAYKAARYQSVGKAAAKARYWANPVLARAKQLVHTRRRIARMHGAIGSHTLQEWNEKKALLGNVCFYCGEAKSLARDHKVPISRGGSDDITNIVPCCKSCNTRKHDRTAREYLGVAA